MKLSDIQWTSACCGESCLYAEVQVPDGWLQIKTSHDESDLDYLVRRYGQDKMPLDDAYVPMTEADLSKLL